MNSQVDIVVIGDSCDGREAVKKIASTRPSIKMAFISREFKKATTHDYLNVEYIKDEVVFTDYRNRLFGVYLKNGDRIYCTHLIVASGLAYEPFIVGGKQIPNVFNNTDDIPKIAKTQPAVVLGNDNAAAKLALAVAKKHKQVYLCTRSITLENTTPANNAKLAEASNIVLLPNTSIIKASSKDDVLTAVELDNYSAVTCSSIYVKTNSKPETAFISDKLFSKDEAGFIKVSNNAQSLLVPKCYAIGTCAIKTTKKMKTAMVEEILASFGGIDNA